VGRFILKILAPITKFLGEIRMPFSKKRIDGDFYYKKRDLILPGDMLLTSTRGELSNLFNPSGLKHGGVYYGKGLKTHVKNLIEEIRTNGKTGDYDLYDRLVDVEKKLSDDVCYVLEAVGKGVIATSLVTFLTTKDVVVCTRMKREDRTFALHGVEDLGKPYDFLFRIRDNAFYCYELMAKCILAVYPNTDLMVFRKLGVKYYDSKTFLDERFFEVMFDSRE